MDDRSTDKQVLQSASSTREGGLGRVRAHQLLPAIARFQREGADRHAGMLGDDPFALDAILDPIWAKIRRPDRGHLRYRRRTHDLMGKTQGVPVWKLLGLDRRRAPLTSFHHRHRLPRGGGPQVDEAAEFPISRSRWAPTRTRPCSTPPREAPDKKLFRGTPTAAGRPRTWSSACKFAPATSSS